MLKLCCAIVLASMSWLAQAQSSPSSPVPSDNRPVAGTIKVVTGLVNLKSADGKQRFASAGTRLYTGDVINTQAKSTAVLEFVDTTQVALRPTSTFVVEYYQYQPDQPIADKAEFKLVKGGLRTLTGLIGKRGNADAFAMRSETATIGIRGTDFTARICRSGDCNSLVPAEAERATTTNSSNADVAGRVSQLTGELSATNSKGQTRNLVRGAAVFAGDVVQVADNGFAVLAMADSTRLTLPGGSAMQMAAYRYLPSSPETSVASFKLLKGAVRAVTGAIAKAEPKNVKFFTDTATIGIRGTALDMACTSAPTGQGQQVLVQCTGGTNLLVEMRQGSIVVTAGANNTVVNAGQAAQISAGQFNVQILNTLPGLLNTLPNSGPLPEQTPANFEALSSTPVQALAGGAQGEESQLFVSVNDGTIVISNGAQPPIEVNRGEGAFVRTLTDLPPTLLVAPPDVLIKDNTLAAPPFTAPQCSP